jgi:uncharacterized membrane protein
MQDKDAIKDEIRHEFQLERMILFSDAVFAIVMTLMAIEIRLPEVHDRDPEVLRLQLLHLIPNMVAYTVSFFFIGVIWYQHLKLFSLLKTYDKGLVIRNLILLFSLGFFPFSVTLVTRSASGYFLTVIIYFSIIIFCRGMQLVLQRYVLIQKPQLRNELDFSEHLISYKKSLVAVVGLLIMFILLLVVTSLIDDPKQKPLAWWVFFPFPVILKYFQRKLVPVKK